MALNTPLIDKKRSMMKALEKILFDYINKHDTELDDDLIPAVDEACQRAIDYVRSFR